MATTQRLSPTANLLRNSRLFSLPPPLPRPSHGHTALLGFQSDSATLPYPTTAAIETTQPALFRGDWGFKRPLPQQSTTNTTTPVIRISAVDSIHHITDFDSAADHTLTLRKWQEMGMPITMSYVNQRASKMNSVVPSPSVFEERFNSTQANPNDKLSNSLRWKYKGPWLAGKTEGEFQHFVEKRIKKRRREFESYLRQWLINRRAADKRRNAMDEGKEMEDEDVEISNEEFQREVVKLRHGSNDLWAAIWEFLDLPGHSPSVDTHASDDYQKANGTPDIDRGPPQTHPSAGLSYLRTASHVTNHPVLGPMSLEPPVPSRILRSRMVGSRDGRVILGVAGIVAAENSKATFRTFDKDEEPGWSSFEPGIEGGAKTWIHPTQASIDPNGRIKLSVDRASKYSIAVWEGQVDKHYAESDETKGQDRRAPSDFAETKGRNQGMPSDSATFLNQGFPSDNRQNKPRPKSRSPYASDSPEGTTEELLRMLGKASRRGPAL